MKPIFAEGPLLFIRLLAAALASVLMMVVDHRLDHLETVRGWLSMVVYPVQWAVDAPSSGGRWLDDQLSTRDSLIAENRRLSEQQLVQSAQLQKLEALQAENQRLRELLSSSLNVGDKVLVAELLSVDMDPYRHQLVINKGSMDGVHVGQPVLDAQGVVGQVVHISPVTATVLLISDPSHAIPVYVNRNGLRTIAIGTGSLDRLALPNLPNNADIRPDDLLISSGLGGRFPPDYPVGRVADVVAEPGRPFARVDAHPAAALERSRELMLVWTPRPAALEEPLLDEVAAEEAGLEPEPEPDALGAAEEGAPE